MNQEKGYDMMTTDGNKKSRLRLSLAHKITIWILIISGIFTILTSAFQLYMDFMSGKESIEKIMLIIESSHINSLQKNVWNMDKSNINTQMDEILNLPNIAYIHLQGKNIDDIFRGDIPDRQFQIRREYLLHYEDYRTKEKIKIGVLTVTASLKNIYIALKDKVVIIIISQAIKTFFVSFFILFLIYSLITRHLEQITKYLTDINQDILPEPLTIDKGQHFLNFGNEDELDLLVSKINSMRTELRQNIKDLNKVNEELNNEIAERKKAEEELKKSEERFRAAFDSAQDCVLIWDKNYNYLYANQAAIDHVNTTPDKVIGKNIRDGLGHVPDFMHLWMSRVDQVFETGERLRVQDEQEMQGNMYHTDSILSPIRDIDDNVISVCVVYRDVTELKKAENELAAMNLHLEKLVEERTSALSKTTEEAKTANRTKSDFLARMSHEIRTPMNGIIGMTDLLLKSTLTSRQKDYLIKVRASSGHLLNIINDLLDFSKIEEGRLEKECRDFMLNHVIGRVADIVSEKSAQKEIELFYVIDKAVPLSLKGDPLRLNQILINLMANAVKFTEKGQIILKVRMADAQESGSQSRNFTREQTKLLFSVQDTGIGISPENIDSLFQPFTQADGSVTRNYGGTGLGLSICRELVKLMGGQIWAESIKGKGSTFFFTLPLHLQSEEDSYILVSPPEMRGLKVLVVDDNETARIIFKEILTAFDDFQITMTGSGPEALAELENALPDAPYDLVILDWRMPDMDGFEVIRKICDIPFFTKNMPKIIMVTMYGREEIFQRIKVEDTGIDGFVFKPISSSAMFNSIMEVFGKEDYLVPCRETGTGEIDFRALEKIKGAEILLAEDNEINQEVTVALLERAGLIAHVAANGREAVEVLISRIDGDAPFYDAVLMDIEMPEMDGYEAVRLIRKISEFDNLPVIAMTAHALKGDREKCLDAGMNDYLTKPVDEQQLCAVLCKWIKPGKREIPENMAARQKTIPEMRPGFPPVLPGINLEAAVTRLRCGKNTLRRMLKIFSEKYEHAADDIRKCLEQGRISDAQKLVHSIKGTSGNLCAEELFLASQELDTALKQGKTGDILFLSERFEEKLTIVISSLKILELEEKKAVPALEGKNVETDPARLESGRVGSGEIAQVVREMHSLLKKKRAHGWKLLDTLLNLLPDAGFHEEKMALEKSMTWLDTQKALLVLSKLAYKLDITLKGDGQKEKK
ncbi:response regulator [Desulfobacterales bacterium HSG17]|nr:response regulator [Desulfobacterales bacterium HSG17]